TLKNDNLFWRRHAQRLLLERGERDVCPALAFIAGDRSVDAIGLNVGAIHALWTLHGLGALDGKNAEATEAASRALTFPSAGVRRNAALVLPRTEESAQATLNARILFDRDPQVRLAALLVLAEIPGTASTAAAIVDLLTEY